MFLKRSFYILQKKSHEWIIFGWTISVTLTEIPILQHELFKIDFLNYLV